MLGLRRSEVLRLRWADLDTHHNQIRIVQARVLDQIGHVYTNEPTSKMGTRIIPLLAPTMVALAAFRVKHKEEMLALGSTSETLIAVDAASRPLRPEWYSDDFKRLTVAAGLP